MRRFSKLRNSIRNVKKPLSQVKNIKHVRWLIPGWVFYEYYKLHKDKGETKRKSFGYGMKAEAIRLAAFASLPLPGSYELTTTGLALLKKKIEKGEVDNLTLKAFRDFTPLKNIKIDKNKLTGSPYLRIYTKNKKLFFDIIYRNKLNEKLFLYGSLMDPKVEYYITGEIVEGYKDILIGYRKNNILIENKFYPIAVKYINGEIEGKIININKRKIKLIDKYEGRNYKRKKVVLKSGISAWVYVRK